MNLEKFEVFPPGAHSYLVTHQKFRTGSEDPQSSEGLPTRVRSSEVTPTEQKPAADWSSGVL